jgi:hypothetical protein
MIRFFNNYTYCYVDKNIKVYTICKVPNINNKVPTNQLRYTYFTEPFITRTNIEPENVLIGFASKETCLQYKDKLEQNIIETESNKLSIDNISSFKNGDLWKDLAPLDDLKHITIIEHNINDVKVISDGLKLPLIIEMSNKNDFYELFYYRNMMRDKKKI